MMAHIIFNNDSPEHVIIGSGDKIKDDAYASKILKKLKAEHHEKTKKMVGGKEEDERIAYGFWHTHIVSCEHVPGKF